MKHQISLGHSPQYASTQKTFYKPFVSWGQQKKIVQQSVSLLIDFTNNPTMLFIHCEQIPVALDNFRVKTDVLSSDFTW
ncbi:CLUMA_CG015041, isoform A [Clunio marinus]|uniref:CLUMA_CG015041, isoform A n=1 Tax=Clunio marinus TaxID=568069 RepID=A0A1J1IQ22_9DIPT|nr:CLUMA_CG015041, isoform A [Clunio marinus]